MAENNNPNVQNRVSTSGITLFDDQNMMLKLGYLGDTLSISLCEPVMSPDTGKNTYPEDKRHPFLITGERAAVLHDVIIIEGVTEALKKGEDYSGGVFLNKGKTSILEIRVQGNEIYLVVCEKINENRTTEYSYVFHFQKTDVIYDYESTTGDFSSQDKKEGTFFLFCKYVESAVFDLGGSSAHAIRKAENAAISKIFEYLKGIASKLGVTVEGFPTRPASQPVSGFMNAAENMESELPFRADNPSPASSLGDMLN